MPLTDNKVRTFLSLAETRSYTATAAKLGLTQPAVSHQMSQLESEYGVKIFDRVKGKLKLTPQGEIIYKYALRAEALSEKAEIALGDSVTGITHLAIGITQTVGEIFVPQMIAEYAAGHPDTRVSIVTDSLKKISDRLRHYELDLAVAEGGVSSDEFESIRLDTDSLVVIVSPDHPLAGKEYVTMDDLRSENFIMRPKKSGTRALFAGYLAERGESEDGLRIMIEIDSVKMIRQLVSLDLGVSVMSRFACREDAEAGKLAMIPLYGADMTREINIICRRDFAHREILGELIGIYGRIGRESDPGQDAQE